MFLFEIYLIYVLFRTFAMFLYDILKGGFYLNTLGERVKYLRKVHKINQQELAEATNISRSNISKIENDTLSPTANSIVSLANYFNISTDWLLTGAVNPSTSNLELEWLKDLNEEERAELSTIVEFLKFKRENRKLNDDSVSLCHHKPPIAATREEAVLYLPILGDAAAGIPIEIIELPQGQIPVNQKHSKHNSFIVRARGDSMIEAGINNGDLVIVRPQPTVENGQIALVNIDGEATIKHFYIHDQTQCELRSANPTYPSMFYPLKDISILGKIVEVVKHG